MANPVNYKTIDEYIRLYPISAQEKMIELRTLIQSIATEATEKISWGMPTFYYLGNLVHFAAHKNHIGFYPGSDCVEQFSEHLGSLKHSKGAIQFPIDQTIPKDLVKEIVVYRLNANIEEDKIRKSKRLS
ncbi:MAG: hypothetical protein CVV56_03060 [Tenericutes bacterium HGW-Tenericutes-1]|jgi:uncharacterized protein YdhG (YjbR/CyaY superfamily)|nr:MAG: hypothetical protein CVV56_03060 [Tenericutes bacterium HGW-Tenericutes-1]